MLTRLQIGRSILSCGYFINYSFFCRSQRQIKEIVCAGYMENPNTGELVVMGEVSWQNSLVPMSLIKTDQVVPWGLNDAARSLTWSISTEPASAGTYICSFCGLSLSGRRSGIAHERRCKAPGSPVHTCNDDSCIYPCLGRRSYERPPDGRLGNRRGKTGRPRKS